MSVKRIIPCLDVKDGRTVKGINFVDLKAVGDPVEMGCQYARQGADELVFLDISATVEGRKTFVELVERVARDIDIPFTVGGGITGVQDAARLLEAGASKVSINSAAVRDPQIINDIAGRFGSAALVVAIDARRVDGRWMVTTHSGERVTRRELVEWAREAEARGAGEILFTSMDHDGVRGGYPCETYAALARAVSIPIIASGGAGGVDDIAEVLTAGGADAALAASVFHYGTILIPELKRELAARGIEVSTVK